MQQPQRKDSFSVHLPMFVPFIPTNTGLRTPTLTLRYFLLVIYSRNHSWIGYDSRVGIVLSDKLLQSVLFLHKLCAFSSGEKVQLKKIIIKNATIWCMNDNSCLRNETGMYNEQKSKTPCFSFSAKIENTMDCILCKK